ncbi:MULTISPECIES: 1-phosphofructokinase [Mycolicibacterium]|uniref:PfkB domain protein n=2 Tax=Mycolicibacterium TaxID=1866885 RepID=A1T196_MYCVP|nr:MULTISPECIES: 1-phosphofructokinase [Mycolicibacterium]ABM10946.1 PfkB domain protein [Mycolicibacterium vanbaalenii PYR-1]MDN4516452.1 1-phosphofructokinase [Mycolicibacterium austroafricanum]QRZ07104.1 1-phosphofructokinase [Mycolicibacterium austroafricanum]QZT57131.1 1-phosphofructokinase [Mycolicibacterium austroafricanum]QZT68589.1 1-phosphofructokinase [Mycolicibacterium austroafricanum]
MIVTVTANPSIDRTVSLPSPLTRGAVHRVTSVTNQAGGKGVNVAKVLTMAGVDAVAVLPAAANDPLLHALQIAAVPYRAVTTTEPARTNLTITEPDGTTTKINEPGAKLDAATLEAFTDAVLDAAGGADWVVMSGSLPPGVPASWYGDVVASLASRDCRVAVDTSDAPLAALIGSLDRGAPDLIKPNAEELAGVLGLSAQSLEDAVLQGDPGPVVAAARQLIDRGIGAVLATLGAAGAVLVDHNGAWMATPPPIVPRSTVGAGDSSLAGYVRAEVGGAVPPQRLQMAVAYGSAAAALPGTTLPSPAEIDLNAVQVSPISPIPATR